MENKKVEEEDFELDVDNPIEMTEVKSAKKESKKTKKAVKTVNKKEEEENISCLQNKRIIVRHIPKETGLVTNPKHILYGGMAENAVRIFVTPRLGSGAYVNVLTDKEKAFLEEYMGLEYNALSVYKKEDNFWDDSNDNGVSRVRLTKHDTYLDLSDPDDYIRYKILLANKNYIAPSLQVLQDTPKATYQFVLISDDEEDKAEHEEMSTTMRCYKEYGKIEDDVDTLRVIIETIDGRPTASNTKLSFLQSKVNKLIQANNKLFLKVVTDPMLSTKVLIKKSIENGLIFTKGNYLYLNGRPFGSDSYPLCENNEEPTLSIASRYLNSPKHQTVKLSLEAKLKQI